MSTSSSEIRVSLCGIDEYMTGKDTRIREKELGRPEMLGLYVVRFTLFTFAGKEKVAVKVPANIKQLHVGSDTPQLHLEFLDPGDAEVSQGDWLLPVGNGYLTDPAGEIKLTTDPTIRGAADWIRLGYISRDNSLT
jgi:hypothetical protein